VARWGVVVQDPSGSTVFCPGDSKGYLTVRIDGVPVPVASVTGGAMPEYPPYIVIGADLVPITIALGAEEPTLNPVRIVNVPTAPGRARRRFS
jgi:hypothetical protein